nr:hypothetical protein Iba_chr03bCG3310 [Ipomoea batatas]
MALFSFPSHAYFSSLLLAIVRTLGHLILQMVPSAGRTSSYSSLQHFPQSQLSRNNSGLWPKEETFLDLQLSKFFQHQEKERVRNICVRERKNSNSIGTLEAEEKSGSCNLVLNNKRVNSAGQYGKKLERLVVLFCVETRGIMDCGVLVATERLPMPNEGVICFAQEIEVLERQIMICQDSLLFACETKDFHCSSVALIPGYFRARKRRYRLHHTISSQIIASISVMNGSCTKMDFGSSQIRVYVEETTITTCYAILGVPIAENSAVLPCFECDTVC